MARAIREDGGDLCSVEGTASAHALHGYAGRDDVGAPLDVYFLRNICRIMELTVYGTNQGPRAPSDTPRSADPLRRVFQEPGSRSDVQYYPGSHVVPT